MTKMAYQWRPRMELPIDPQVAGEELQKLRDEKGEVDAATVIETARSKKSPLHGIFEWNDGKAANIYRRQQAEQLIKALVVTVQNDASEAAASVRVSVRRTSPRGESGATAHVFSAEEVAAERVKKGWRELETWVNSFGHLPEFTAIAMALQGFLAASKEQKKAKAA